MYYLRCFMCNALLKQKNKSNNSVPSSLVEKVLKNVWEFPECMFTPKSSINDNDINQNPVISCKKCVAKLRRISKIYNQLQTLVKLLAKLQTEVEISVRKVVDDTASGESSLVHIFQEIGDKVDYNLFEGDEYLTNGKELRSKIIKGLSIIKEQSSVRKSEDPETTLDAETQTTDVLVQEDDDIDIVEESKLNEEIEVPNCSPAIEDNVSSPSCQQSNIEELKDRQRLECEGCNFTFKDEIARLAHWRKRHEGQKYPYHCDKCAKRFGTRKQLTIHLMCHSGETPFICEHCGKGFRLEKLLTLHLKNKHTPGPRDFKCSIPHCTLEFTTLSKLNAHLETHSNQKVPCTICRKEFSSKTALNVHSVQHSDSNPWKCFTCEKTFSCHSALKNHSSLHNQSFKFVCNLCPFGGPSKSALDRHMIAHTGEKGFRCGICGNEFKYKKSLSKHLKAHTGLKNYECDICGKQFLDNYKLRRHVKIHEGDRPFICDERGGDGGGKCNRSFYTKDALKAHKKCHTTTRIARAKNPRVRNSTRTSSSSQIQQMPNEVDPPPPHETSIMLIGREDESSSGLPSSSLVQLPMTMQFVPIQQTTTLLSHNIPVMEENMISQSQQHPPPLMEDVVLSSLEFDTQSLMVNNVTTSMVPLESLNNNMFPGSIFQFEYLAP